MISSILLLHPCINALLPSELRLFDKLVIVTGIDVHVAIRVSNCKSSAVVIVGVICLFEGLFTTEELV